VRWAWRADLEGAQAANEGHFERVARDRAENFSAFPFDFFVDKYFLALTMHAQMVKFLSMALSKGGDSNGKKESSQEVRQEKEEVRRPIR
jgi:hypothetical protein